MLAPKTVWLVSLSHQAMPYNSPVLSPAITPCPWNTHIRYATSHPVVLVRIIADRVNAAMALLCGLSVVHHPHDRTTATMHTVSISPTPTHLHSLSLFVSPQAISHTMPKLMQARTRTIPSQPHARSRALSVTRASFSPVLCLCLCFFCVFPVFII
jgi:hypothetical protein